MKHVIHPSAFPANPFRFAFDAITVVLLLILLSAPPLVTGIVAGAAILYTIGIFCVAVDQKAIKLDELLRLESINQESANPVHSPK